MAKKITVAMMRNNKIDSETFSEIVLDLFEDLNVEGEVEKRMNKKNPIAPLDLNNETDQDVLTLFGMYVAILAKKACTPKAYEYLIEEFRKELKTE